MNLRKYLMLGIIENGGSVKTLILIKSCILTLCVSHPHSLHHLEKKKHASAWHRPPSHPRLVILSKVSQNKYEIICSRSKPWVTVNTRKALSSSSHKKKFVFQVMFPILKHLKVILATKSCNIT